MMNALPFKIILLVFTMVPLAVNAHTDPVKMNGKYTKEKTIKREYGVNADALLMVQNSYGNLNITSWSENRIMIEVHIKANGNDEEGVQERLEEINVEFENNASKVSAKTQFGERNNNWNWGWGKRKNVSVQVNYTIKLPVKNNVNLSNDYGNIYLDRIDGNAKISCDYGKIDIGELRGDNNQIHFDYTSRSTFDYIKSAEILADYSVFAIEKAGDLTIKADYTNGIIEEMNNLTYSSDYGSIEVNNVNNVDGNGDYIGVKLGNVHGNVSITNDYGSLKIDRLAADAGNVEIRTAYTGVKIGYDPKYNFDFEISTEYAGVGGKDDFQINMSKEQSTEKYYRGYYGKPNSGNRVSVTCEYGSIKFQQN